MSEWAWYDWTLFAIALIVIVPFFLGLYGRVIGRSVMRGVQDVKESK